MIKKRVIIICLASAGIFITVGCTGKSGKNTSGVAASYLQPGNVTHTIVFHDPERFAGWPANNGAWVWDGWEILVGMTIGPYYIRPGHNLSEPYTSLLARSKDGGMSWEVFDPDNYIGDGDNLQVLREPMNLSHPDFALRVTGVGYHASEITRGGFYYSLDRGNTWRGPFLFNGLESVPELIPLEFTPRTDYLINSDGSLQVFLSVRVPDVDKSDRLFCARSIDGGLSFELQSWIVSFDDPNRAVMSSTVRYSDSILVTAVRRREPGTTNCWIDAYVSHDNGNNWKFLSKVGITGPKNGNPPALIRLREGQLVCAYGNRETQKLVVRISTNHGADWSEEIILRDDFLADEHGDSDLGYPRMMQRSDGKVLTMYYWATETHKEQHIAATIWDPEEIVRRD